MARHGPSPYDGRAAPPVAAATDLTVEIENDHWLQMRVWVEWPGVRHFLGDVNPGTRDAFHVPAYLIQRLGDPSLYAECMGSIDEVHTDPIHLGYGHRVEWRLKKVLENSRPRVM
jgi:hypothetical protein